MSWSIFFCFLGRKKAKKRANVRKKGGDGAPGGAEAQARRGGERVKTPTRNVQQGIECDPPSGIDLLRWIHQPLAPGKNGLNPVFKAGYLRRCPGFIMNQGLKSVKPSQE